MEFKEKLRRYQDLTESAIDKLLPPASTRPSLIHEAMRYSMQAGGKRLRPVLALATCELFGKLETAIPAAISLECIHTYSLIHDDLPALDNADLRRGLATCHKKFDESTAILAGDALLTYAFQLLSKSYAHTPELAVKLLALLSDTAGSEKLIGGQVEDILGETRSLDAGELEFIHKNKTSALIEASLLMGALVGNANQEQLDLIRSYGKKIGLSFQVTDDILDATSDSETLGKDVGNDAALNKTTYITLYGLEKSRQIATELTQDAIAICKTLPGDTTFLEGLANYLDKRIN
ncbi:polyprenyl synthetase family protein [Puniceicoccaceae bacterium K14]|nr:polyprenyl synthetase family protein [Puniceicoccaceae bacterium K14]